MVLRPYLSILALPGARAFAVPGMLARLPMSMVSLAILILVHDRTHSFGVAGAVSATYAVTYAAAGPALGRWADRFGQRRVLLPALAVHVTGLVGLVLMGSARHLPTWPLFVFAVVAGSATPPYSSLVRARWSVLLDGSSALGTAMALESVADEVVFTVGPVLVTSLAAITPTAGLCVALVFVTSGTLLFVRATATEPRPTDLVKASRALGSRGLRTVAASYLGVGLAFGSIDVVMVAFATAHGWQAAAGVLIALVSIGSMLSGLVYGGRVWERDLAWRFVAALGALTVGVSLLTLPRSPLAMLPLALIAGIAVSPTLISGAGVIQRVVAPSARTEGFAVGSSAINVGAAAGAAIAGRVVDSVSVNAAFLVCPAAALVAFGIAALRVRTMHPSPAVPFRAAA
jgi:MFS family permease